MQANCVAEDQKCCFKKIQINSGGRNKGKR